MNHYIPLSNRIVGRKMPQEELKSPTGIILTQAESLKNPYIKMEIVSVGRGHIAYSGEVIKMESTVGDIVLLTGCTPFILPKVDLDDESEYMVFAESDIFVRLKREGE